MNKTLIKIICIVTIFSISIISAIGSIILYRSTKYLSEEISEKIVMTAENYSNDFSSKFNHMQGLTDSVASQVSTSFEYKAFKADPNSYMADYKSSLSKTIRHTLVTANTAHSLYVTFNPDFTKENDEVWWAMVNGKATRIYADFKKNKRDFDKPYNPDMEYFFKPQNKTCGVWTGPYYDKDIKQNVFSYSRAIYLDGQFIGVAGADITATHIVNIVNSMKLYRDGATALLDKNNTFIVRSDNMTTSSSLQKALKSRSDKSKGSIRYSIGGKNYILGFARLDNGWTFVITQPVSQAFSPVHSLKIIMIVLGVILAITLIAFLLLLTVPFLKKQHFLETENNEKEIMMIYQSRQAKLGEMIGNITHQWKQPLNTINLILANLLDSYRYGTLDEKQLEKSLSKAEKIIEKMSVTITDFSDFLKPSKEKEKFDMRESIAGAVSLMEESMNLHHITVDIDCEPEIFGYGYPNEFIHTVFNVLNNARDAIIDASPDNRVIHIKVSRSNSLVELLIENEGQPIPAEDIDNIFKPYFTTREKSGGTGLGLYISKEIIEERMQGKISMENTAAGVRCRIQIPAFTA